MMRRTGYSKAIVRLVGRIVPEDRRSDWREEWHAELDAVPDVSTVDVIRGALIDALLLRVGAPDEWLADTHIVATLVSRHPLGLGAAIWIGTLWFASTVVLATLCAAVLAGHSATLPSSEMLTLTAVGLTIVAAATCAAVAAIRAMLRSVERTESGRQRWLLLFTLLTPSLALGFWLVRVAFTSLAWTFDGVALFGSARAAIVVAAAVLLFSIRRELTPK